jgi:hypothetical protein
LRDRAALGALLRPTGDADAQGIRGDRGSGSEHVRALGRLRGAQLPGRDGAERLSDVVKFHWERVHKDGEAFGVGLNFLVLAADGRIERDYTLVESEAVRGGGGGCKAASTPTAAHHAGTSSSNRLAWRAPATSPLVL